MYHGRDERLVTILEFITSVEQSVVGDAIRDSLWLFPAIQSIHLIGLALLGGCILILDLRMLGIGLVRQRVRKVHESVRPYFYFSLVLMVSTGIPLAVSQLVKLYHSNAFKLKLMFLALALTWLFSIRNRCASFEFERPFSQRLAAVVSIALWVSVAVCGRWIGYS